jgi:hypothetical protein
VTEVQTEQSPLTPNMYLFQVSYNPSEIKARDVLATLTASDLVLRESLQIQLHEENELLESLERKKEIEHYKKLMVVALIFTVPTFIIGMVLGMIMSIDHYLMTVCTSFKPVSHRLLAYCTRSFCKGLGLIFACHSGTVLCWCFFLRKRLEITEEAKPKHGCAYSLGYICSLLHIHRA